MKCSVTSSDNGHLRRLAIFLVIQVSVVSCGLGLDDDARMMRAQAALDSEQYPAAVIDLKSVLRNTPDNALARKLLGLALTANGEPEAAEKELQRALELGQPLSGFRVALAEARLATGQAELALDIADPDAAADDHEAFLLWLYRGDAQADLGEAADALRSYQQAEDLNIDKATALLRAVELYWGADELEVAKGYSETALQHDPANVDAHLTLGAILLDMDNPQGAEETLTRAVTTVQADAVDEGYLLAYLTEAHLAQADVAAARDTASQVAELWASNDPELWILFGQVALAEGDNDTAAMELLAYLNEDPESAEAKRMLGAAQLGRGLVNQAIDWLGSALAANADDIETRTLLARAYLGEGRPDQAREVLEPALELTARDPTVLSLLGVIGLPAVASVLPDDDLRVSARDQLIRGEVNLALATARTAVADHRDDASAVNLLGICQLADGQWLASVESHNRALMAEPANMDYRLNLARAHLGNSAPEEGLKLLRGIDTAGFAAEISVTRRALVVDLNENNNAAGRPDPEPLSRWLSEEPDDAAARLLLGETYIAGGSFADAAEQYELLLEQTPDDSTVHNNLAWSYLQIGDNRARAQAEHAYELDPNDGTIADTLGWILVSMGEMQSGAALLRDAHILQPDEPETAYHLAFALSRIGAEDEARALLEAILEPASADVREAARDLLSGLRESE